jgi:hypothetical protein
LFGTRRIGFANIPPGWYVKAVLLGDADVTDSGFDVRALRESSSLEVVLSNRGSTIAGRVTDDQGNPVARAEIAVIRAGGQSVPATTRSSATGAFTIGPLRDGDYVIVALAPGSPSMQSRDWERLRQLAALGERLTLAPLEERALEVRVKQER